MKAQPGFSAHTTTLGQGPRRALALHCTMAFGGAWAGMSKIMGDKMSLVAPDMPSHGRSADWDTQSSFGDTVYAASLAAMDEGPMDVIGHSFGGVIALRLAVEHPEKVRSLTVIEPVFFAVAQARAPETLKLHNEKARPFMEACETGDYATAARLFNRMWSDEGPAWDTLPERTRAAMTRGVHVVPDTTALLYEDTAGLLAPGALDALTIPTLVMRGADAHPAITATNEGLAEIIPGAVSHAVPGAGHMAPISHPQAVAEIWSDLLDRTA